MNFTDDSNIVTSTPLPKLNVADKPKSRSKEEFDPVDAFSSKDKVEWSTAIKYLYSRYLQSTYLPTKQATEKKNKEEEMKHYLNALIELNRKKINEHFEEKKKLIRLQWEADLERVITSQLDTFKEDVEHVAEVTHLVTDLVKALDEKRHQIVTKNVSLSSEEDTREIEAVIKSLEGTYGHSEKESIQLGSTESWSAEILNLETCQQLVFDIEDLVSKKLSYEIADMLLNE